MLCPRLSRCGCRCCQGRKSALPAEPTICPDTALSRVHLPRVCIDRKKQVNIRILVPEKNNMLRDEQGNYAGQGTARRTYYMLHTAGSHFEALKAVGKVEPIDGWAVQEV